MLPQWTRGSRGIVHGERERPRESPDAVTRHWAQEPCSVLLQVSTLAPDTHLMEQESVLSSSPKVHQRSSLSGVTWAFTQARPPLR